jgi:hypothetical protein
MVMTKRRDFQILWVVLIAAACWGALWEHEPLSIWVRHAWSNRPRF